MGKQHTQIKSCLLLSSLARKKHTDYEVLKFVTYRLKNFELKMNESDDISFHEEVVEESDFSPSVENLDGPSDNKKRKGLFY